MKILFFDLETTGIDPTLARPIQFGGMVLDLDTNAEVTTTRIIYEPSYGQIPGHIEQLTGLTHEMVSVSGYHPKDFLSDLARLAEQADCAVAHNLRGYDQLVLDAECKRQGLDPIPWKASLDSQHDFPYPDKIKCRKLSHLALDHGFAVDPSVLHQAGADVDLLVKIAKKYDLRALVALANEPWKIVQALVSYDNREQAKARGYSWQKAGDKVFEKCWVKRVRASQMGQESSAPFTIRVLE